MPTEHDQRVLKLFEQALDLPEDQRARFLKDACGDDEAIRNEVNGLLSMQHQSADLLPEENTGIVQSIAGKGIDNDMLRLSPGQQLAERYKIIGVVGVGGMGEVYHARDLRLDRDVAIKVLSADLVIDPAMRLRFDREARSAAALAHPNIVTLHDIVTAEGLTFAVSEYVRGKTLRACIKERLEVSDALRIGAEIALGLQAAHDKGLMHRDIKPENVIVTDAGGVKILDFGLARHEAIDHRQAVTASSTMSPGTVPYMSPEQVEGGSLTCATDIFSLGTVLYEMFSGFNPFRCDIVFRTMQRITQGDPPALSKADVNIPAAVQAVLDAMLCVGAASRPTAGQVAAVLQAPGACTGNEPPHQASDAPSIQAFSPAAESVSTASNAETSGRPIIAVLPLRALSPDPNHQLFGEAIAEEIILELSRLRWLPVIARGSSFRFTDSSVDLGEVRRVLGAKYLLSGTMRVQQTRATVSVELCHLPDQRVVWADRFESPLEDVLQFRFLVTAEIVGLLESHIQHAEAEAASRLPTENLDAWSAYHRGLAHMYRFTNKDNTTAGRLFAHAINQDPHFARAYAGLSFTHFQNSFLHQTGDQAAEQLMNARRNAEKALELDPIDPFANLTVARVHWLENDLDSAGTWLDKAIELNPSYAFARYNRALIDVMFNQAERGEAAAIRAKRLSPIDPLVYAFNATHAMTHLIRGHYDLAVEPAETAITHPAAHVHIYAIDAVANKLAGRDERAMDLSTKVRQLSPAYSRAEFFRSFPFRDTAGRRVMEDGFDRVGL